MSPVRKAELRRHRARFRVAHEIAHSFFYARAPRQLPVRPGPASEAEEDFCDVFARELLLPSAAAERMPPSAGAIARLQSNFDVSMEVAARALASAHPTAEVALFHWAIAHGPDAARAGLKVQWASHPKRVSRLRKAATVARRGDTPVPGVTTLALQDRRQCLAVSRS
jgi:Zn-dependent peptidase ImmA (M78 family)